MNCQCHALVSTRLLLNFRLPLDSAQQLLRDTNLQAEKHQNRAVLSFCYLQFARVRVGLLPTWFQVARNNAAFRLGAIDPESGQSVVYLPARYSQDPLAVFFGNLRISNLLAPANMHLLTSEGGWQVNFLAKQAKLSLQANLKLEENTPKSLLFPTVGEFADWMKAGVRSYAPAANPNKLQVIDLHKPNDLYIQLTGVDVRCDWLNELGAEFDSAFWSSGGDYTWEYIGNLQKKPARQNFLAEAQTAS
jgi:hypothetical protein